jgi:hypothetical protein
MNLRNTYFLFGAVILVLVVFVLVLTYGPRGEGEDYLFPDLHGKAKGEELAEVKKSIDKVEIERLSPASEPLLFEREGTRWTLKKPYIAHVDGSAVERLINSLIDAKPDPKAQVPAKGQAGLDPPSAAVTLFKGDKGYRAMFGQISLAGGGRVYAATGEKPNKVLALRRSVVEELLKPGSESVGTVGEAVRGVTDFRAQNLLADGVTVPWEVVQRVVLTEGKKEIILQKDANGGWNFEKPDNYGAADLEGDPTGPAWDQIAGVKPLLTRLAGLRMPKADDIIEGAPDPREYGLGPGQEQMRIEFKLKDSGTEVLLIGRKVDDAGTKVYATLGHERFVVKLDAKALEPIKKVIEDPKVLRDRNLTSMAAFMIDAVDIKLPGEKPFELRKVGTPPQWRIFEGTDAFDNANFKAVNDLLEALTARRNIRDFPDTSVGDKALGLDTPAVQIDLWQGGIIQPEPPPPPAEGQAPPKPPEIKRPSLRGEPNLRLTFGKKDKDIVYVRRAMGIASNVVALPESILPLATRPLTSYLDLVLPSFERDKVTKLFFNRGAVKYELAKPNGDPASETWSIAQPPDIAGRTADTGKIEQILTSLQTLTATSVLARKATDAELTRYGLKTPKTEAAVALKDVKDPKVYQFGSEADDKKNLYFRFGGSDRVYLVEKARLDPLFSGEVIDPTIWRLDATRIKGIKLTGWKSLTGGKALTLDLVRKSPTEWSVKDQADYVVDAVKAETFAAALALVRTDRFIKSKGGPGPEHKLDPNDDALVIEVTVDGEKEPFVLTVGGETKDNNTDYYFATSNKTPGAVFLVFRERFAEVRKSGRGFFQKPK